MMFLPIDLISKEGKALLARKKLIIGWMSKKGVVQKFLGQLLCHKFCRFA